jgi:hypothetical protein
MKTIGIISYSLEDFRRYIVDNGYSVRFKSSSRLESVDFRTGEPITFVAVSRHYHAHGYRFDYVRKTPLSYGNSDFENIKQTVRACIKPHIKKSEFSLRLSLLLNLY